MARQPDPPVPEPAPRDLLIPDDEQVRELLVQAGITLSRSLNIAETLSVLSDLVVPRFADWFAVHLLDDDGRIVPSRICHADPARIDLAWQALARWPELPEGRSAPATVIRTGEAQLAAEVDEAMLAQVARNESPVAASAGCRYIGRS